MLTTVLPPLGTIPARDSLRFTPPYTEAYLDQLRTQGDPLADEVVAALAAEGALTGFHDLLGVVRERAAQEGGVYQAFLDACNDIPEWADFEAMRTGQRMLAAFPVNMGIALFTGSLVGGAVFVKMALVTSMTGMLSGDSSRRLDETAAMVLRMAFPGNLEPGGEGHELLMRVRMLHAAIRRFLVDSGRFAHPVEVPINQQDLAITLGLFGYLNIRSLAMMNIHFNDRELDSFNLLWRYTGHVLGIRAEVLPDSVSDQQSFFLASLKHQARPERLDARTRQVMDNVAASAARRMAGVSEPMARKFLYQSCRWLSGNEYVTGMEIEDAGEYAGIKLLKGLGRVSYWMWRYVPGGQAMLYAMGARGYRRALARMARTKDKQGEYRVRTVEEGGGRTSDV